jgi:hypothetical protein
VREAPRGAPRSAQVAERPLAAPQDKEKVLADVRGIISEQLGTEIEKVRGASRPRAAQRGPRAIG